MSDVYNANSNKLDEEQSEADQAMEIISGVANQRQSTNRHSNLAYTNQIQEDEEGAFSHDSVVIETTGESRDNQKLGKLRIEKEEDEEEPSNPRGFFYNFDYPVQLILQNSDDRQQRSIVAEEKNAKMPKTDESELNSSLEAEVADYKIVKRSENSKDTGHISEKNDKPSEQVEDVKKITPANRQRNSAHPQSKNIEAQIPVYVKIEHESQSGDSLPKSEMELRRLATNEDVIDAVHDVQIHRIHA